MTGADQDLTHHVPVGSVTIIAAEAERFVASPGTHCPHARSTCAHSPTKDGARAGPRTDGLRDWEGEASASPQPLSGFHALSACQRPTAALPEPALNRLSSARFSGHFSSRP